MSKSKLQTKATSPPELRGRVERAIRGGKFQTGLDLAKQLLRAEPTPENRRRLIECYLGRARQLLAMGAPRDADVCLDAGLPHTGGDPPVVLRFAEELARCGNVRRALDLLSSIPEPRPANRVLPLATDAALQRGTAEDLPDALRADFERVRGAFAHLQAGADAAAREAIQGIRLASPFLEWKVLLRGLLAYFQRDDGRAIENWSRLDATRLPARLAAPLRLAIDRDFAVAQPPETQAELRRQADRLTSDSALAGLRRLQTSLVKAQGRLANVFREAESVVPILKQRDPALVQRLARVFYWEIIEQGQPEDTARYLRLFGKPADDPDFARLGALAMEREAGGLPSAHAEWQRYEKSLAQVATLSEPERARARAMVWLRMADNASRHLATVDVVNHWPLFDLDGPERPRALNPPAEKCLRRAIQLAPDWLDPQVALVNRLKGGGRPAEAVQAAEGLLKRFPEHLPTLEMLARLYQESGDVAKAAPLFERALAVHPLNRILRLELMTARRRLGTRLAAEGCFAEARRAFESARGIEPESPHPIVNGALAACEFKAGNAAAAEELLRGAAEGPGDRLFLDGWMYAHAMNLKLPKAIKDRFEKPFKQWLESPEPKPEEVAPLLTLFILLEQEGLEYRGAKTHRKKAIAQVEKTAAQPYREEWLYKLGMSLIRLEANRTLRKLAAKWSREFPASAWPPFFVMESYTSGAQERWPLWRLGPLAERAKALGEKMPPGPARDNLMQIVDMRLQQFRDLNPFARMFEQFGEVPWEEDETW